MWNGPHASCLAWPKRRKGASFTYIGSSSEIREELYSECREAVQGHREGLRRDALLPLLPGDIGQHCHRHGHSGVGRAELGDGQWSQLLAFSAGGWRSVVKQTAIRAGSILVVVYGAPGLVEAHLAKAVDKAHPTRCACPPCHLRVSRRPVRGRYCGCPSEVGGRGCSRACWSGAPPVAVDAARSTCRRARHRPRRRRLSPLRLHRHLGLRGAGVRRPCGSAAWVTHPDRALRGALPCRA